MTSFIPPVALTEPVQTLSILRIVLPVRTGFVRSITPIDQPLEGGKSRSNIIPFGAVFQKFDWKWPHSGELVVINGIILVGFVVIVRHQFSKWTG